MIKIIQIITQSGLILGLGNDNIVYILNSKNDQNHWDEVNIKNFFNVINGRSDEYDEPIDYESDPEFNPSKSND